MESTATIPPGIFLIILAVTVIIALIAGYAARMFEERSQSASQAASAPETELTLPEEEQTILKIMLDESQTWNVEIDGARVTPDTLTAEQRTRLVNIIVQLRPWIDGKAAPAPAGSARTSIPAPAAAPPPAAAPVSIKLAEESDKDKNKISIGRGFRSLMANDLKILENARPPSIVSMIDDFLQKRLDASPLAGQDIHLEEGPLGEVIVFVGKTRYAGVDDVPDPEIRAMIKSAIKDWEKSS